MKRIVIKVGTHVLFDEDKMASDRIENLCKFLCKLLEKYEVILVTSGSIATGVLRSKIEKKGVVNRQMLAAVGQPYLMEIYNDIFAKFGVITGQILLTEQDLDSRKKTDYFKGMIDGLCAEKILPIINENDALGIKELLFGDNDQLSAAVAHRVNADMLVILSDIDGYYTADPRMDKTAQIRPHVSKIDECEMHVDMRAGTEFGTGGIVTKLKAADFLLKKGRKMYLTSGFDLFVAHEFLIDEKQIGGTLFSAEIYEE